VVRFLVWIISAAVKPKALLVAENLCLRQQLLVLQRRHPQPRLRNADRQFWICAGRWFAGWRKTLLIVKPETVLRWHRRGWRAYCSGAQIASAGGLVDGRFPRTFGPSSDRWLLRTGSGVKNESKPNSQDWDLRFLPGPSPST
jgi:hypothetical protein